VPRKRIDKTTEYVVTAIGYGVGGPFDLAEKQAVKASGLRKDIWSRVGSLQSWGIKADNLYKSFQVTNPPVMYGLDFKQWQRTFNTVIDDIHACQESAIEAVSKKVCKMFKSPKMEKDSKGKPTKTQVNPEEPNFRLELLKALKHPYQVDEELGFTQFPILHRWIRSQYYRGRTYVDNQVCVGIGNGATIKRKSRNVVSVTFSGESIPGKKSYQKITLDFKVGRLTPKGNMRIIFRRETGRWELHFPRTVKRLPKDGEGSVGMDKGFTEAFYGSDSQAYGDGIGKVMIAAVKKRHVRGKARNKLFSIAKNKNKPHIAKCNLGKKRWTEFENRKKRTLTGIIRTGVNQIFNQFDTVITEDLSGVIKGKKAAKKTKRNLSEWRKGTLQKSLDEISYRRSSAVVLVNAAYTSQVDSRNGTLLGFRSGDRFLTYTGDVIQADYNAAVNIKNRLNDPLLTRFMRWEDVHAVLMKRTASFLLEMDLTIQDAIDRVWLDPKHIGKSDKKKGKAKSKCLVA